MAESAKKALTINLWLIISVFELWQMSKLIGQSFFRRILGRAKSRPRPHSQPFCEVVADCNNNQPDGQRGILPRVLVTTQPKAGTYLVAEILSQLGFHNTYLHLAAGRMQAYDRFSLEEGLRQPRNFDVNCGIEESRKLVRRGELAVSHLHYSPKLREKLAGFKIIHVKRELRSAFISWSRMLLHSERSTPDLRESVRSDNVAGLMQARGKSSILSALAINEWAQCNNVLSLKMEEITSDPTKSIGEIFGHVECTIAVPFVDVWERATAAKTLTDSKNYTPIHWNERDEAVFRQIGGPQANQLMGYIDQEVIK